MDFSSSTLFSQRVTPHIVQSTEERWTFPSGAAGQRRRSMSAYRDYDYIASQRQAGWRCLPQRYDDGGYTGANKDRPALGRLLT